MNPRKVVGDRGNGRVHGTVCVLGDGERALEQRLGFIESALCVVERAEVVEGLPDHAVLVADDRLPGRNRAQESAFRLVEATRLAVQECQVRKRLGEARVAFSERLRLGERQFGLFHRLGMIALAMGGDPGIAM